MKSIRRTLGLRLAGAALALFVAAAVLVYGGVRWLLTEQFDAALCAKLATFTTLIEQDEDEVELGFVEQAMPEFRAEGRPEYVELWYADHPGDWVLYRSPSLVDGDLPRLGGSEEEPVLRDLVLPDGRAGRALGAEFVVHAYDPGAEGRPPARLALVLARGTAELDRALWWLTLGMTALIVLLLGVGFLVGERALERGLRPLGRLARHVQAISDPARAGAFEEAAVPVELAPLVESHNRMLERLRAAFERERRTAANIAHELRTPVSELVVLAELAQRCAGDERANAGRLRELREIGEQMSALIATLLELARMESGQVPIELERIDLGEMLHDCWDALCVLPEASARAFPARDGSGPPVYADRAALSILLSNLLRNAIEHAPPGTPIDRELASREGRAHLVLSNVVQDLEPDDVDRLAEPFWRASAARAERGHAGLGLSLARRLADLLAIELSFELEHGVFRARLAFPPGPPASATSAPRVDGRSLPGR